MSWAPRRGTRGWRGVGDPQELAEIRARDQRRQRRIDFQRAARNDPDLGRRVSSIRRTYPWLALPAIRKLALTGNDADSDFTRQVAAAGGMSSIASGRWERPGEAKRTKPRRAALPPGVAPLRPGSGGGFIEDVAGFVGEQIEKVPGLEGTFSGEDPSRNPSPIRSVEESLAGKAGVLDELRGVSRGFALGAQVPADLTSASIRRGAWGIDSVADQGFFGTWSAGAFDPLAITEEHAPGHAPIWKQSPGLLAGEKWLGGDPVNTGSGWFPNDTLAKEAAEYAGRAAPKIDGRAFTLGRYITNEVGLPPESIAAMVMSGAVDAVIATKYDPANIPFGAWTEARRAGKRFAAADEVQSNIAKAFDRWQDAKNAARRAPLAKGADPADAERATLDLEQRVVEARKDFQDLVDETAGVFTKGHRPWASPKRALQWFQTDGKEILNWSVNNSSPYESWMRWGKRGPAEFHQAMADATTPEEALGVVSKYVGGDIARLPAKHDWRILDNQRWAQMAPADKSFTLENLDGSVREMDRQLRNAKLPQLVRQRIMDQAFRVKTHDDVYQLMDTTFDAMRRKLIREDGITPEAADQLTSWGLRTHNANRMYGIDAAGENIDTPFAMVNGQGVPLPSAMLPTELLSSGVPYPDFRAIRRATGTIGKQAYRLRGVARQGIVKALKDLPEGPLRDDVMARLNSPSFRVVSPHTGKDKLQALGHGDKVVDVVAQTKATAKQLQRDAARARRAGHDKAANALQTAAVYMRTSSTADWQKAIAGGAIEGFGALWRRSKLARLAWGVRVVGEEQARMWAYGFTGAFNHPIQALAIVAGHSPKGNLAKALQRFGVQPRNATDVYGGPLGETDEILDALNGSAFSDLYDNVTQGLRSPSVDMWRALKPSDQGYNAALAEEVFRLSRDPIANKVAGMTRDDAIKWLETGEGRRLWDRIARPDRRAKSAPGADLRPIGSMSPEEQRALIPYYVDSVNARIDELAAGSPRIRQAVATKKLGDATMTLDRKGGLPLELDDEIRRMREEIDPATGAPAWSGPANVRARQELVTPPNPHVLAQFGQTFDAFMWNLMPRPSNYLSRSPMFRQHYWSAVKELASGAAPRALQKLRSGAQRSAAKNNWRLPDEVGEISGIKGVEGGLSLKEIDEIAKARALDGTRSSLYDLSERGQFWDVTKAIIPFGEAYGEVLTRWARLVTENPKVVHRLDQAIESGREAGIIHKDPYGQEVITIPGSEWLTKEVLGGVPVGIDQSLQGANIVGNISPGIGANISIGLPYFAKLVNWDLNDPGLTRTIMETIYPYGRTDTGELPTDVLESTLTPALARFGKYLTTQMAGAETDASVRSSMHYFMGYLASTDKYDLHGESGKDPNDEMRRLVEDAAGAAKNFQLIRAIGSFTLPSAPIPKYLVNDPNNRLAETKVVVDAYYKKVDKVGYEKATDWFMENFGTKNFLLLQPVTEAQSVNLPRTRKQADFMQGRDWLRDLAPEVYGLAVPPDARGDSDVTEMIAQTRREGPEGEGERKALGGKKRVELANQRVGFWLYEQAVANGQTEKELKETNAQLMRDYPGYKKHGFDTQRTPRRIEELRRFAADKRVLDDPDLVGFAGAVISYLEVRDWTIAEQKRRGLSESDNISTSKSGKMAALRKNLRETAEELMETDPRFRAAWEQVLSLEVRGPARTDREPKPRPFAEDDAIDPETGRPMHEAKLASRSRMERAEMIVEALNEAKELIPKGLWKKVGNPKITFLTSKEAQAKYGGDYSFFAAMTQPQERPDGSQPRPTLLLNLDAAESYARSGPDRVAEVLTHELGHAWAKNFAKRADWYEYARIRGFDKSVTVGEMQEDYAQTFAFAHGMLTPTAANSAGLYEGDSGYQRYSFSLPGAKGLPSPSQMARLILSSDDLLPKNLGGRAFIRDAEHARGVFSAPNAPLLQRRGRLR